MRSLTGRLHQWWDGRTVREQRMLMLMALLVAAVVVWLGVIRPTMAWRDAAAAERVRAQADLVEVRAGLARLAPSASPGRVAEDAGGLEPLVRRTAEATGLQLTTEMDASGGLAFRISSGSSAAVFGWLAALQADHGVDVRTLGVVENTDASLQVEGSLSR